jgi:hypothetical protein
VAAPLQGKERIMEAISTDYIYKDKSITQEKVNRPEEIKEECLRMPNW